jgi:flagellar protein FlaG
MRIDIGQLTVTTLSQGLRPGGPAPAGRPAAARTDSVELSGSAPPPEALAAVKAAAARAAELHASGRELHFELDKETKRVIIQVRDLEGNVLRTIPPSTALDVMSGAEL